MLKFNVEKKIGYIFKTYEKIHNGAVITQFNSRTNKIQNIYKNTKLILRIKLNQEILRITVNENQLTFLNKWHKMSEWLQRAKQAQLKGNRLK